MENVLWAFQGHFNMNFFPVMFIFPWWFEVEATQRRKKKQKTKKELSKTTSHYLTFFKLRFLMLKRNEVSVQILST